MLVAEHTRMCEDLGQTRSTAGAALLIETLKCFPADAEENLVGPTENDAAPQPANQVE